MWDTNAGTHYWAGNPNSPNLRSDHAGPELCVPSPSPRPAWLCRGAVELCPVVSGVQGECRDPGLFQGPVLSATSFCYRMRGSLLGELGRRAGGVYA